MNEVVSALVSAIEQGRTDVVRCAITTLEKGEEVNGATEEAIKLEDLLNSLLTSSGTLLHMAAKSGQIDVARALLSAGADPGVHNEHGQTSLDIAQDEKMRKVFHEQLLQAVARNHVGSVCQLIAAGVDVNLVDTPLSGNTPLHWAASYGDKDIIHCLIKRGARVNAVNVEGATPLHDAMSRGDVDIIEELLLSGADPFLSADNGKYNGLSAQSLAEDQPEVIQLIHKYKDYTPLNGYSAVSDRPGSPVEEPEQTNGVPLTPTTPNALLRLNMENGTLHRSPSVDSASSMVSPDLSAASSTLQVSVVTDSRLHLLWPQPAKICQRQGAPFKPQGAITVYVSDPLSQGESHHMVEIWRQHEHYMSRLNLTLHIESYTSSVSRDQAHVVCQINSRLFPNSQCYRLTVTENMVRLDASDMLGLHYGIMTFCQLLRICHVDGVPAVQIRDEPCIRDRGVLLDMSKGRVPTLVSLRNLIQLLSHLKINQLQLYTRFQVPRDPEVRWQFPYPRSTLLDLDRYAQALCVTLVPTVDVLPSVIFDDLPEIHASFDQYVSCFSSAKKLAVGPRLSSFLIDLSEDGDISADDTRRFIPAPSSHTIEICGYLFHDANAALLQLPQNTMLAEYGFQANYDFNNQCRKYEESGVAFTIVPGTAAWNSLAGCPEAAVSNCHNAAQSAVTSGALGMVVSHWSGIGHMTHHPMCLTGILSAAGLSWNTSVNLDFMHTNLADLLNTHVLEDTAGITGQVILELGRAETYLLRCSRNQAANDNSKLPAEKGSTLFQLLCHPDDVSLEHLTPEIFQKCMRHIRKCQSELEKAQLHSPDGATVIAELQVTADFMLSACRIGRALINAGKNPVMTTGYRVINPGIANLVATAKTDLANRLLSHMELYRSIWLRRNLPQGLHESMQVFSKLLKQLIPDVPPHDDKYSS